MEDSSMDELFGRSSKKTSPNKANNGALLKKILDEITQKVSEFETRSTSFYSEYNDASNFFTVKSPSRKSNTFSNPRLTEMYRAVNALSTMEYRILTSQDPFFEFVPMDDIGMIKNEAIQHSTELIRTQQEKSKYKSNLFRALLMKNTFGSVVVEEPFETVKLSHLGRRLPVLKFVPRSMLQVSFDKATTDIEDGQWVATSDFVSTYWISNQAKTDPEGNSGWITSEVDKAIKEDATPKEISDYYKMRLQASGYETNEWPSNIREVLTYHGKIDALNDGLEYQALVVNRQHVVKFSANPLQTGVRPFRVAHFMKWELEPLGYGVYKLFGGILKSMDSNRQKVQDIITFAAYSMFLRDRYAGINDKDMIIKPWGIIDADNLNAMKPLEANVLAIPQGLTLEGLLQKEFRTATGATDTMQAIITEATASEVSLAQNEAMRNISVKAELSAETLLKEHVENQHAYNQMFIKEPIRISSGGMPVTIYPQDLLIDVDVRLKIVTDKDFKPERLKKLLEGYQIMSSIRNTNPDMMGINLTPYIEAITTALDIPANKVLVGMTPERMQQIGQATQMMQQFRQATSPGMASAVSEGEGLPGEPAGSGVNAVQTPVGATLGSAQ